MKRAGAGDRGLRGRRQRQQLPERLVRVAVGVPGPRVVEQGLAPVPLPAFVLLAEERVKARPEQFPLGRVRLEQSVAGEADQAAQAPGELLRVRQPGTDGREGDLHTQTADEPIPTCFPQPRIDLDGGFRRAVVGEKRPIGQIGVRWVVPLVGFARPIAGFVVGGLSYPEGRPRVLARGPRLMQERLDLVGRFLDPRQAWLQPQQGPECTNPAVNHRRVLAPPGVGVPECGSGEVPQPVECPLLVVLRPVPPGSLQHRFEAGDGGGHPPHRTIVQLGFDT